MSSQLPRDATTPGGSAGRVAAPRPVARRRALVLLVLVAMASAVFGALALGLRGAPGTSLDVALTRGVQRVEAPAFELAMWAVSAFGWPPLNVLTYVAVVGALWLAGFRRDALFVALAPLAGLVSGVVKLLVARPRPDAELVRVASELLDYSFPSGHVVSYVSFYGFVFFLAYVRFRPAPWRTAALLACGLLVGLVGLSRIYLGHHWASDVVAGYALGGISLVVLIEAYRLVGPAAGPTRAPRDPRTPPFGR